jgi:3',5'-nucleoside bisphosphate phosphatase
MARYVDLHLHSTFSDGVHPPAEVVRMAAQAGLAAIALCDHDHIGGIDQAQEAGRAHGVEVLAGVELSTLWQQYEDIHLLGYGFDPRHSGLQESLAEFRAFREGRNDQILRRVNERLAGEGRAPIDFEAVRQKAGGTLGRPHIAMALMEAGYVKGSEEAFVRYLVPCNVPKRFFPLDEAIALVHRAGGAAVLAHPPYITPDLKTLETLLDSFVALGLDGVEAWNSGATNNQIDQYITLARRRGLIVTGGSDYHGIEGGEIQIGGGRGNLKIPYACVEEIRQRLARMGRGEDG